MDRFPLLDPRFDEHHRARRIENGEVLNVLRPMTHEASMTMVYDERFGCGRGFQLGDRISSIPHNLGFLKETFSRQKKKITNWQLEHQCYIDEWMLMEQNNMGIHAVHCDKAYDDYLVWLGQRTRLQLRPAWTEQDIADIASEDEGNNPYDQATQEGRQVEIAPALARAISDITIFISEGEDDEGQGEYYEHEYDEIGMSQLEDAPQGTQVPSDSGRPQMTLSHQRDVHSGIYPLWEGKALHSPSTLRPAWTEQDIADIVSEDEGNNPYDQATREGRQVEIAPALARVSMEIMRTVTEKGRALMIPVGDPDEASMLRQHIQVAARLGCRRAPDVAVPQQLGAGPSTTHVGGTSSSHGAHVGGTSSSHGAATSVEGGQGHGPYDDEGEHQGEDDEGQGEYYEHEYDEIGMS
ncbi:unnamed protein product [Miscanthus lutarioriparius]|uniref:Uncharacterized protein n=1 Tax=Miscanthus lutarioriparius TaxID=422564 RepID=A0A811QF30_9POAL|nr:unnamed protein product [Miscanthus lutarioriparius]